MTTKPETCPRCHGDGIIWDEGQSWGNAKRCSCEAGKELPLTNQSETPAPARIWAYYGRVETNQPVAPARGVEYVRADLFADMTRQRDGARVKALEEAASVAKLYHEKALARFETLPPGDEQLRGEECASTAGSIEMAIRALAEGK